jgi:hypothetical protein
MQAIPRLTHRRFITCRLPDDEDAVTFTFMDEHEGHAARWADAMLLFEPAARLSSHHHQHQHQRHDHDHDGSGGKQLQVRRLWNRARLLKRLDELRRQTPTVRSRVGSPVWANGYGANGGRLPVALTSPAAMQRGDIWW